MPSISEKLFLIREIENDEIKEKSKNYLKN